MINLLQFLIMRIKKLIQDTKPFINYYEVVKHVIVNLYSVHLTSELPLTLTLSSERNNGGEASDEEVETKERSKKRGESNRIYLDEHYPSPWTLLPVVNSFEINNDQKTVRNLILELYGLDSRIYADEPGKEQIEFEKMIKYSINKNGLVYKINEYLRKTLKKDIYKKIKKPKNETFNSWESFENQMGSRYEFFLLNLVNWKRDWYKELSLTQLVTIIKEYKECIQSSGELPKIREVWIEDGKKWRVLAIAKPGVRLFLSGLTKFMMEFFNDILDRDIYHGFMHSRGVNTYWKRILEEKLLESEIIIEMDFSAAFNNVRKWPLLKSLLEKYKVPPKYVKLIIAHLNAEILQKDYEDLPSIEGQIERYLNKEFNLEERNLIQGLPICPILMNLAIKNGLDELKKELGFNEHEITILAYADDLCIFMNPIGFRKIGGKKFVETLNNTHAFRINGLQIDPEKSSIVKNGAWEKDLKLLGLKYKKNDDLITSETRGRLENKIKKIKAREVMKKEMIFHKVGNSFYEKPKWIWKTAIR